MAYTNKKIPTRYARKLAKNYRVNKLGKPLKIDDTHAVWFPREVFLEALNVPDPDPHALVSGIRIYIGAYEEGHNQPDDKKKGKLTLIMVQTRNSSGLQKDILETPTAHPGYPWDDVEDENDKLAIMKEYNDGQLCPPPACDDKGLLDPDYIS